MGASERARLVVGEGSLGFGPTRAPSFRGTGARKPGSGPGPQRAFSGVTSGLLRAFCAVALVTSLLTLLIARESATPRASWPSCIWLTRASFSSARRLTRTLAMSGRASSCLLPQPSRLRFCPRERGLRPESGRVGRGRRRLRFCKAACQRASVPMGECTRRLFGTRISLIPALHP